MNSIKLSVSVAHQLAQFIERYQATHRVSTKSEVVERALELLQKSELKQQYAQAYREWAESGEAELWDITVGDGLDEQTPGKAKARRGKK
jgi:Arc/MetJ-type ribon-helix-helix transcriptional regulator